MKLASCILLKLFQCLWTADVNADATYNVLTRRLLQDSIKHLVGRRNASQACVCMALACAVLNYATCPWPLSWPTYLRAFVALAFGRLTGPKNHAPVPKSEGFLVRKLAQGTVPHMIVPLRNAMALCMCNFVRAISFLFSFCYLCQGVPETGPKQCMIALMAT